VIQLEQSVQCVCVCLYVWTTTLQEMIFSQDISHKALVLLDTICVRFKGQFHSSKFTVKARKCY